MDEWKNYFDSLYQAGDKDSGTESALHNVKQRLGIGGAAPRTAFIAAACSAIIAATAIAFTAFTGRSTAQAQWNELRIPDGQTAELNLADGSHLVLGGGSRLTYPSEFTDGQRLVFLEGEVLADIAKDEGHPFVISSGNLTVKVHGTRFDFKAYRQTSAAELFLMEGSVSLNLEEGREITMNPGDLAQYDRNTGDIRISHRKDVQAKTFAIGRHLHFLDTRMSDIAFELEKTFGVKIVVSDRALAQKRFFAYFTNGESLDEILSSFNSDKSMLIVKEDETYYLSTKDTQNTR